MPFVKRDPFVCKLWVLGFEFVSETSVTQIFRKGDRRLSIPKVNDLDEEWVRRQLERCAVDPEKVGELLAA